MARKIDMGADLSRRARAVEQVEGGLQMSKRVTKRAQAVIVLGGHQYPSQCRSEKSGGIS